MKYTVELNDVRDFPAWSGGKDNLNKAIELGKADELNDILEEVFMEEVPTKTQVNDFLWFDLDELYPDFLEEEDEEEDY